MNILRNRASLLQNRLWKILDDRVDWISTLNRRQAPILRGQVHYDAKGWLEDNRDLYTFDGKRVRFIDGRPVYAIRGGTGFVPPIGIPDPGWGTDTPVMPALPSPWSNPNTALFYYVSQTGNDANGNGRPAAPRRTIPNPV